MTRVKLISKAVYKQKTDFVVRIFKEKKNILITHIDSDVKVRRLRLRTNTSKHSACEWIRKSKE